jgi:hypothetical protein
MGRPYKNEVAYIPHAIAWAIEQDVVRLRRAILSTSSRNLYAIGSGGSSTVAVFAASCHERRFGQVSRAVTPLEYQSCGAWAHNAATLLLSAEGKNKDILYAARSMLLFEHPGLALTLRTGTPLEKFALSSGALSVISYEMPWQKDGYLATNSLIATLILLARAYSREGDSAVAASLKFLTPEWLCNRRAYIEDSIRGSFFGLPTLLLYGSVGRTAAIDVESKFAEAALGTCQLADFRQFAHGRHLQLKSAEDAFVIAFSSPKDFALSNATLALLPNGVRRLTLELPASEDIAAIQGVIDAMLLTEVASNMAGLDPGQPEVPNFCRAIHQLDPQVLVNSEPSLVPAPVARKLKRGISGANEISRFSSAGRSFAVKVSLGNIKALICDFDGTFCETDKRFDGLDPCLIEATQRILQHGVPIAFATGRGDSLLNDLRKKIDRQYWHNVFIGYYSGSHISSLDQEPQFPPADPRFNDLLKWLGSMGICAQIEAEPKVNCGQLGLRCGNNAARYEAVTAIRLWIKENLYQGWRVYCSGHSIDVLAEWVGKKLVVDFVARRFSLNPDSEVLRLGDSGQFDGNDYELLCEGLGLSVLAVSPDPATCWNFLPIDRRGVVGTQYYLNNLQLADGKVFMPLATMEETLTVQRDEWERP